jgi:hypothetical protein
MTLLGASVACGDDVYDAAGVYVGDLEEIMFDTVAGRIEYVVILVGGFLGIGQKRYAIPWSAISFDPDYRRCALSIDRAQLMDAPALDDDHWLRMADPAWANEIQAYYGGRSSRA